MKIGNKETLTLNVENNTPSDRPWQMFGYEFGAPGGGSPGVTVPESSTEQANRGSATQPFKIVSMKIHVSDPAQFAFPINIYSQDVTGHKESFGINPGDYENPQNANAKLIDTGDTLGFLITGQVQLNGTIKANSHMSILLGIKYGKDKSSYTDQEVLDHLLANKDRKTTGTIVFSHYCK